jgi:hypothetical protein
MPDLFHSLLNRDIGHLRIVADLWGVELHSSKTEEALKELCAGMLHLALVHEIVEALPEEARSALQVLVTGGGKLPWASFARQFGELRLVGAGRRDREQVHLQPASAAETLFYRALLAQAFFDTPAGAQEFAYVPEDLVPLLGIEPLPEEDFLVPSVGTLRTSEAKPEAPYGRPALPKEHAHPVLLCDRLLDDAATLLAALRLNLEPPACEVPVAALRELLEAAGILSGGEASPEKVRNFLEMERPQALKLMADAWRSSDCFNELRLVPGLVCEGEWQNDARLTRRTILGFMSHLPVDQWWSLAAFVSDIHDKSPDFQRPAGDYDSWFIRRLSDDAYLRGFGSWDEVDGALIRYMITGPLYWLGKLELAEAVEGGGPAAFRIPSKVHLSREEKGRLTVRSGGRISVPRLVPRAARYQIARFCEWEQDAADEYRYRITSASLKKAESQGLKAGQLLSLLARNASVEIPPAFIRALKRWEKNGSESRLETRTILRVSRPEVLEELRKSPAGRFLGDNLGPVAVVVKAGASLKVQAALMELGLLVETEGNELEP